MRKEMRVKNISKGGNFINKVWRLGGKGDLVEELVDLLKHK